MAETVKKRSKIENFGDKRALKKFTPKNQPTPKQKSDGWNKKRTLKEILTMTVSGVVSEKRRIELLEYLGLPTNTEISIEQMLHLKQIITSLKSNTGLTTHAYEAIMKRAFGTKVDVTSDGEKMDSVVIYLPDNKRDKK